MSYDLRIRVKAEGCDRYPVIAEPEYDSPTYNLGKMFRACMDWDYNQYEKNRALLTKLLFEQHKKHPSHGYHMLAEDVFQETGWKFSHNLAHKCCKIAGIQSKARKYSYKKKV